MATTKKEYMANHPKSKLAHNLKINNWPENTPISIIGGLDAPYDKRSNLCKELDKSTSKEYCFGGHRQRGTEGWWIAVRLD